MSRSQKSPNLPLRASILDEWDEQFSIKNESVFVWMQLSNLQPQNLT